MSTAPRARSEPPLPVLGEPSRRRQRLVGRTPKLVAGVLLVLLAGWAWVFTTWRFEVTVEVVGQVVEASSEGVVVELTLAPTTDDRVPPGALRSGLPFAGTLGAATLGADTLGAETASALRLTGVIDEVARLGDRPTLRGRLDPLAPEAGRPRVGAPVAGYVVVRSATGLELVSRRP